MGNPFGDLLTDKQFEEFRNRVEAFSHKRETTGVKLDEVKSFAASEAGRIFAALDENDGKKDGGIDKNWLTEKVNKRLAEMPQESDFVAGLKKQVNDLIAKIPTKPVTDEKGVCRDLISSESVQQLFGDKINAAVSDIFNREDLNHDGIIDKKDSAIRKKQQQEARAADEKAHGHGLPLGKPKKLGTVTHQH